MPPTDVYFFQGPGDVPVLDWMLELRVENERALRKCFGLIELLREFGSGLRRPQADYSRWRLRAADQSRQCELSNSYGFVGKDVALLACGLTKEREIPDREIDRAVDRIARYQQDSIRHRYVGEEPADG